MYIIFFLIDIYHDYSFIDLQ